MNNSRCLNEWLIFLEASHPCEIELGLERIQQVASNAQLLNFAAKVVTVAGTNGKGSTVATLAKLLRAGGLKVATYTSPHLLNFRERIQINGMAVSEAELITAFEKIEASRRHTSLTFFEFTTLAAFAIFQQPHHAIDVVILEVGLGGRLDAVNVIAPDLAILTTIGLDHQEWLGHSREEIAKEKAGILRSSIPVIVGKDALLPSIVERAKQLKSLLYMEEQDFGYCEKDNFNSWYFEGNIIKLNGLNLPVASVSLAMAAYTLLKEQYFKLPNLSKIANCLVGLRMRGRAELISLENKVTLLLDVAHNADGANWLKEKVLAMESRRKIIAVWASLKDKALEHIIEPFKEVVDYWYIGEIKEVKRAASAAQLKQALQNQEINEKICISEDIETAFKRALNEAGCHDVLLVFGSFHTVAAVMKLLLSPEEVMPENGLYTARQ